MSAPAEAESLFTPRNFIAFVIVSLIWGGTWLVIRDQIASVPASWSISYRFVIAALGMFALAALRREPLLLVPGGMRWAALLGLFQFTLNFAFVYNAEAYITSGLVAVMFALLVVPNAVLGRIFLHQPITGAFVLGSLIAAIGVALLFAHEWRSSPATLQQVLLGAGLTVGGILSASAANITQAMEGAKKQPFLALLAWAMTIGVLINTVFALATAGPPQFDPRPSYTMGILFLGLAGSVVTFPLYYGLVRKVGAGKAAYSSVIVPVVAMILSTLFEGFVWGPLPAAGAVVTLVGMVVAMRGRATVPPRRATPEP
ncbi:Permease of the drug/metabolite transporter (DMT) superfamily [Qipengyuania citrea LAMA 915]|jgi:drug/metabolite transporter (DMT)-like permease|uniref:Permease of the drug/metabolite transporter (DMT) superfamily n=1 Tax=Qipengyuania citrea LAMA 915 TaxID=1306953 RepID=A0A0L1K9T1_9SPHN|nr:EamA family transporter [Qipengyuania citrea]KNH00634.1 Permease of the drug/metabolite transporter (DMT) superfamily [Qipengyuania citrea LAMA 915]